MFRSGSAGMRGVYGHTTTATHDPLPPAPSLFSFSFSGGQVTAGDRVIYHCLAESLHSAQGNLSYHVPGSVYCKAPKRQLYSIPIAVSGSGHYGNDMNSLKLLYPYASPSHKQFLVLIGCSSHPSCDSPNTSRRFALGASNVCLVGENPTFSVPVLYEGVRGSLVVHTTAAMHDIEYISPSRWNRYYRY